MMSIETLAEAVREHRAILFAGGGVSQNLGLPDFQELIEHICKEMKVDASRYQLNDYPVLAEAYVLQQGKIGKLRSWMDTRWHNDSIDIQASEIHRLILELDFPAIYTTNYDRWLERAYEAAGKPFVKIANVRDLAQSGNGITEIIKYHGDFDDDDSIVLTENSYFERMNFETPLDLRLRADTLARPIFFLGYSLRDINMRYLLFKLQQIWESSPHGEQRPASYVLSSTNNIPQEAVLRRRGVEVLTREEPDPGIAAVGFLKDLVHLVQAQK